VARRLTLHRRIGAHLEQAYGAQAGEIAAPLARHFTEGQDMPRAVVYLQRAAAIAIRRQAHREAIDYLTRALQLLKTLPESPERTQQELLLHTTLGTALIVTRGYAAVEVERVFTHARQLCYDLGDTPQLFPVLVGLRRFYQVRAALQTAYDLGRRILAMAERHQESAWLLEAHFGVGIALYYLGDFTASCQHCEKGLALYDPIRHRLQALTFGQDPGVVCQIYRALGLWALGFPEQALRRSHESIVLARELGYPYSLAFALLHRALLHAARREVQAVSELATTALALAQEHEFPFWIAWGTLLQGWAIAAQGNHPTGIAQMHQGLDAVRAIGAAVGRSCFLALLAEAYGAAAQPEQGLAVLGEALKAVDDHGERYYEAEIYRLTGELLLACAGDRQAEAEVYLRRALDIARRQQARSLELRAVMSLSRFWQQHGKRVEAYQVLAKTWHWFTEGFDTPDLQEAQSLLASLR
jgi:predicted ATPase